MFCKRDLNVFHAELEQHALPEDGFQGHEADSGAQWGVLCEYTHTYIYIQGWKIVPAITGNMYVGPEEMLSGREKCPIISIQIMRFRSSSYWLVED